ncbi:SH3 domain-containing protein [Fictibacillus aquaticus]|uniref:SH3 domain-containing protein n=1 Tax=Fictibacillus aquaticus TaxID=2021314 RepID=UPI001056557B|nr:SH3 domain-containing protein [Fictibacillus aquaticus]
MFLVIFLCIPAISTYGHTSSEASVTATSLNVRKAPGTTSEWVGSVKQGATVTVLAEKNGWAQINYKNIKGWASSSFLKKKSHSHPKPKTSAAKTGTITASSLNVRSGPSTTASIVGSLKNGSTVTILVEKSGWAKITSGSLSGWASSAYIIAEQKAATPTPASPGKNQASGKVTASYLNVRTSPSMNGTIIGGLGQNTTVTILKESSGWLNVQYGKLKGWVSGAYVQKSNGTAPAPSTPPVSQPPSASQQTLTVLYNNVNLRSGPSTSYIVVGTAQQGDNFNVIKKQNDWVQIKLKSGKSAWIAGWLASVSKGNNSTAPAPVTNNSLKGKRIVIDPGHGGYDSGAVGRTYGTKESILALTTARLLATQLENAGATVIMTRSTDQYISLSNRVSVSHYHFADAFVSLHYNSAYDKSANGLLTFYYGSKDYGLASAIDTSLAAGKTGLAAKGLRVGDFQVLRTNKQPAVLVELGFLSNANDELIVRGSNFQSKAAAGIAAGLMKYFK